MALLGMPASNAEHYITTIKYVSVYLSHIFDCGYKSAHIFDSGHISAHNFDCDHKSSHNFDCGHI